MKQSIAIEYRGYVLARHGAVASVDPNNQDAPALLFTDAIEAHNRAVLECCKVVPVKVLLIPEQ